MTQSFDVSSLYGLVCDVSTKLGISVIPLTGKRPPVGFNYKKYQRQKPTEAELSAWFQNQSHTSYGILCGSISDGLLILDFDSRPAYDDACTKLPFLQHSYSVLTRRGVHVYLRTKQVVASQKIPGGDLLGQGSLAVGVGSMVDGHLYTCVNDSPIRILTHSELTQLRLWTSETIATKTIVSQQALSTLSPARLHAHYRAYASTLGRNNALYRTALAAVAHGIPLGQTSSILIPLHVIMPPNGPHKTETSTERQQEAKDTIASAYRRKHLAARKTASLTPHQEESSQRQTGLPNGIREALLKTGSTIAARLLDAFTLSGWTQGTPFTTKQAVALGAQYGLSYGSVLSVLSGQRSEMPNGKLIERVDTEKISDSHPAPCNPVREKDNTRFNSNASMRGRRAVAYRVPTLAHLQKVCDVPDEALGSSDLLQAEDLRSERAYRTAMHRELIKRESPELSYAWHAIRLSVTRRTIARYNRALNVVATPIIGYEPLTWAHIHRSEHWIAATQAQTPGRWLQTPQGQRYPANHGLAMWLMARTPIILCRQLPSRFELPSGDTREKQCECIWRRLDGTAPDWGGGLYDNPITQQPIAEHSQTEGNEEQALIAYVHSVNKRHDDLTQIKGLGSWRAQRLNSIGLVKYAHLAAADPARLARISQMGEGMTEKQAAFWIDQARALMQARVCLSDLKGWSYPDWKIYRAEVDRIDHASPSLKRRLADEFREKGWLKYGGELPADFLALVEQ